MVPVNRQKRWIGKNSSLAGKRCRSILSPLSAACRVGTVLPKPRCGVSHGSAMGGSAMSYFAGGSPL